MADFTAEKNTFDMHKLSSELEEYCRVHKIGGYEFSKIQLIAEEYLANILFPNFSGTAEISISQSDESLIISFSYNGADYMNKITDASFLSLKILQNKTKEMKSFEKDGRTFAEFVI